MTHNLLKGKKGLIFGALNEQSIAWQVAEKAFEEGAQIVLTNAPFAMRLGNVDELAKKCNTVVIPADATKLEDIENLIVKTMEIFGGKFDFILHSIGMSPNVRKGITYDNLNYDYFLKTLDVSALSFHKMLQISRKHDALNDWGSVVALSYVAAQRTLYGYNDMGDAKALLESIARSFGYIYGRERKIRINTISQSPTATTAGQGIMGFDGLVDFSNRVSPLGNADAEECANFCVTMFSDFTRKITMQNIFHDGGFSSMGMSKSAMDVYNKNLDECCEFRDQNDFKDITYKIK
ncbi:MAG: enoyl-ACP reductase [Bacteroidetes bacterium GWA2_31_9b]|nr:MAG: enoyl-ACP reductase [Bacteroidetes bacterium GWA2_31_9b]